MFKYGDQTTPTNWKASFACEPGWANNKLESSGGDLTKEKVSNLFNKWPEILALGEKMDFISVCNVAEQGDVTKHCFRSGYFNSTSAIDAIQFKMSSGEIQGGTIKMYGIA